MTSKRPHSEFGLTEVLPNDRQEVSGLTCPPLWSWVCEIIRTVDGTQSIQ